MSDRPDKLGAKHFGLDTPIAVTITDTGQGHPWVTSGEHEEYGPWFMYAAEVDGVKRSFFPSGALQDAIMRVYEEEGFGPGSALVICKHERSDGKAGIWWAVGLEGTPSEPPGATPTPELPPMKPTKGRIGKVEGINRMARAALTEALLQYQSANMESLEGLQDWASTIFIAYQKSGVGPSDFSDPVAPERKDVEEDAIPF